MYLFEILYFSVLFINSGNFSQLKWRKLFSPKIRLFKVLDIWISGVKQQKVVKNKILCKEAQNGKEQDTNVKQHNPV